jgi:hypothetical protein
MEPTYTVLGGDGNQYGPVTAEQLRGWAREGRINAATQIWRSDTSAWVPASALPELGVAGPAAAAIPAASPLHVPAATADPELEKRMKSGAGWFYWIAGFSAVNSILTATGSQWGFALGLGVTTFIDGVALGFGGSAKIVAITLNLLAAAFVATFGFFAGKGQAWAFIVGMIVLGLDTALTGLLQMWLSLALHLFALFCIFSGFKASRALR